MRSVIARSAVLAMSLSALLAGAVVVPAPAAAAPLREAPAASLAPFYDQDLEWSDCYAEAACAWLTVPLDYADPAGRTIRLWVSRVRASGSAGERLGTLQVHPGGPGASGAGFSESVASMLARVPHRYYDIVGFDTRGVGRSRPVECFTGPQLTAWLESDQVPDTAQEERRLMRLASGIAPECLRQTAMIARHLGTDSTVQDMDVLRAVLGDDKLNFLGFSYGTYVGALYAQQFPDRVGRFVLDGAMDPTLDLMEVSHGQSDGMQVALRRFADHCSHLRNCPFAGSTDDVLRGISRTFERLERTPLPTNQPGRMLHQSEAISATITSLYSREQWWPVLRAAFRQTERGRGSAFLNLFDYANGRVGPDEYDGNSQSAFLSISCWDQAPPPGRAGLAAAADEWSRGVAVPSMARAMAWGNAPCTTWFGHGPLSDRAAVSSTTTAPIVIVGTRWDPATPYHWSVALNEQLATSTLVTSYSDGHTAYGIFHPCVSGLVDGYLVEGVVPPAGATCR